MKQLLAAIFVFSAATSSVTDTWAQRDTRAIHQAYSVSVFRLKVDGPVAPSDTFWVAFGPLRGLWGIIQLHTTGSKLYVASASLPRGRTLFSFIQGRGIMHSRLGAVPGNPIMTIRQIGPTLASGGAFPLIVWHEPIG